ncbi:MAG: class I SAM-dependent methyltransferase [Geminicoccaceae bacterium]
MSSYERYDQTSAHYDRTRWPIGVEIIVGCLAQGRTLLGVQAVLDAGCGTANYSAALLDHVERIIAVDRSDGMLAVARRKLAAEAHDRQVELTQASIDAVPLPDASVDGVMVNQVLHHLADDPDAGYPVHCRVLEELARVLRPGGVFVINSCSHEQIQEGFWPYHLIPDARAAVIRRLMPFDQLEAALGRSEIAPKGRFVPVDAVLQGTDYLDPRGPLRADWRAGDSIWALATEREIENATCRLRELDEQSELDAYVASHDAQRRRVGQITLLYGVKT